MAKVTTHTNTINGQAFETATKGRMRMVICRGALLENLSTGVKYESCNARRVEWMCYREVAGTYLYGSTSGDVIRIYPSDKVYRG